MTPSATRGPSLETIGMSKSFGALKALERRVDQGAGRLVPRAARRERRGQVDARQMHHGLLHARQGPASDRRRRGRGRNPRDAQALGVGMVYQHFTLVPSLTAAENLVVSRADAPAIIDWRKERKALEAFLDRMPFRVPLDRPVSGARGRREAEARDPQAALSRPALPHPRRADLGADAGRGGRDPRPPARHGASRRDHGRDDQPQVPRGRGVLRRRSPCCGAARRSAAARSARSRPATMAAMMIGDAVVRPSAARAQAPKDGATLEVAGLFAENDEGRDAVNGFDIKVQGGRDRRHRRRLRQRPERARRGAVRASGRSSSARS